MAPWHALSPDHCLERLESRVSGLHPADAAARLERCRVNELPERGGPSLPGLFARQFHSPLIYLLLVAALLSLLAGERVDAGFILAVLLINATFGTVQERRACSKPLFRDDSRYRFLRK